MGLSAELKPVDKATSFSLIKLENRELANSDDYLGKKNLVTCSFSSWSGSFDIYFPRLLIFLKNIINRMNFFLFQL